MLSKLRHVHIIQFYGIGRRFNSLTEQYNISIVMAYAPKALAPYLESAGPLTEALLRLVMRWAGEITDAMCYLHRNDVTQ